MARNPSMHAYIQEGRLGAMWHARAEKRESSERKLNKISITHSLTEV